VFITQKKFSAVFGGQTTMRPLWGAAARRAAELVGIMTKTKPKPPLPLRLSNVSCNLLVHSPPVSKSFSSPYSACIISGGEI